MTRSELEHAIRAACDVTGDSELWVFGSQAILGSVPDAPAALRKSREVDICPKNHPEKADLIDGALGELSRFDHTHGFYVHGLTIGGVTLPAGSSIRKTAPDAALPSRHSATTSATSAAARSPRTASTSSWYLSRKPRVRSTRAPSSRSAPRCVSARAQSSDSDTPGRL